MNYLLMIEFPLKIFLLNSDCKRTLFTKWYLVWLGSLWKMWKKSKRDFTGRRKSWSKKHTFCPTTLLSFWHKYYIKSGKCSNNFLLFCFCWVMHVSIDICGLDSHFRRKYFVQCNHSSNCTGRSEAQEFKCVQKTKRTYWRSKQKILYFYKWTSQVSLYCSWLN